MDDETYLTLDSNDGQGTSYFTSPTKEVSCVVKFISHTKFPKQLLLWLTISEKGMSKPLFFRSGLAVNGENLWYEMTAGSCVVHQEIP